MVALKEVIKCIWQPVIKIFMHKFNYLKLNSLFIVKMLSFFITVFMSFSFLALNANQMTLFVVLESLNQCFVVETPGRNTVLKITLNHTTIEQLK